MKCTFCQRNCLPVFNRPVDDIAFEHGIWMCANHPSIIRFEGKTEKYSILTTFQDQWYEFEFFRSKDLCTLYYLNIYTQTHTYNNEEYERINRTRVKDIPKFSNITPENAQSKLNIILLFS